MSAANEVLVDRFLKEQIRWTDIAQRLEDLMQAHAVQPLDNLDDILAIDALGRMEAGGV
jgi:1-deoxy-D-xylulose-5-phosphate reductoisomerase